MVVTFEFKDMILFLISCDYMWFLNLIKNHESSMEK